VAGQGPLDEAQASVAGRLERDWHSVRRRGRAPRPRAIEAIGVELKAKAAAQRAVVDLASRIREQVVSDDRREADKAEGAK
jgi:hypothetical protein